MQTSETTFATLIFKYSKNCWKNVWKSIHMHKQEQIAIPADFVSAGKYMW